MLPYERTSEPPASVHEAVGIEPSRQSYRAILLVVAALASYLYLPLLSGGRLLIPSFPTVALMPLLYLTVRRNLSMADKLFLPKITFVLLLSIALSPGYAYLEEKFLSLVQFCLAMIATVMTVRLMQQMRREVLERALLVVWCLLLVGSVLEVAGLTREISDAFRTRVYEEMYTLYDGDLRDISFVGWVRPKVFSTEPSCVTKMFIVSINAWLLIRVTRIKAATVAAATGAMFVIMGSPMFVVSVAMTLAILVWNPLASLQTRVATILATLVVSILFVTFFGETAFSTVETRIQHIGTTEPGGQLEMRSENLRAVIPWVSLLSNLSRWPIFGVGFGGKEVVLEESGLDLMSYKRVMGANASAEVWTYLGLLGGTWFIWLLLKQASQTGVRRLGLMLITVFLFSQLMGALDSFRYWGHVALLWGALAVADSNGNGAVNSPRSKGSRPSSIDKRTLVPKGRNSKI